MAASVELLSREPKARSPFLRVMALVALAALAVAQVLGHRAPSRPRTVLEVTSLTASGTPAMRLVPLSSKASQQLTDDLRSLQPGRISCGSPGPDGFVIRFAGSAYDVNGECARVVRKGTTTALVESAALHDDLAALSGR
jgi:hypothetical protein